MTKIPLQDVVPPEGRSIRNVTVKRGTRRTSAAKAAAPAQKREPEEVYEEEEVVEKKAIPAKSKRRSSRVRRGLPRWTFVVSGAFSILFLIFAVSLLFSGARITVEAKKVPAVLEGTFVAYKDPGSGELAYQIMTLTKESSKTIGATGSEKIERRASGKIVIFNTFSDTSQKLITNTRFSSPDGLIYRIDRSIFVPGQKTKNGEVIPGSIEVTVYADFPGDEYNIDMVDFAIPGLKNDPREGKIFARSKTAMAGGFSGTVPTASESDLNQARTILQTELREQLLEETVAQKPEQFVIYPDSYFFTFDQLPLVEDSSDSVIVNEKATLHAVMFDTKDLSRYIASQSVADFDGNTVIIDNINTLEVAFLDKDAAVPAEDTSVSFTMAGTPHIRWTYDGDKLREDLAGQPKLDVEKILALHPGIDSAEIVIRPFWKKFFPERITRIKVRDAE
ncbi:hypothetical protein COB55_00900 [Candidatus Wolfebacteria bacterium]|nr:MAG: hypothetical protein COB55_00900 [Candidatus Wolfebacteria bacterium]